jgi:hypothetical protein
MYLRTHVMKMGGVRSGAVLLDPGRVHWGVRLATVSVRFSEAQNRGILLVNVTTQVEVSSVLPQHDTQILTCHKKRTVIRYGINP